MLVFSALVPHPPLAIPAIGGEQMQKTQKTVTAFQQLEQELYAAKPEIIFIISPHAELFAEAFSLNIAENFNISFEQFGDFNTQFTLPGNTRLFTSQRCEEIRKTSPLAIITEEKLDHGAGIPLYYLTKHLKNVSIIPIGYSLLDYSRHIEFGVALKNLIANTPERIAVIASGDMSHCLSSEAPGGYAPEGKIFDESIIKLLSTNDLTGLFSLDPKLIEGAGECGFRSLLILLGIIKNINWRADILSYEAPFGVGYLVTNFKLS